MLKNSDQVLNERCFSNYEYMNFIYWNRGMKKQMHTTSSQLKMQLTHFREDSIFLSLSKYIRKMVSSHSVVK